MPDWSGACATSALGVAIAAAASGDRVASAMSRVMSGRRRTPLSGDMCGGSTQVVSPRSTGASASAGAAAGVDVVVSSTCPSSTPIAMFAASSRSRWSASSRSSLSLATASASPPSTAAAAATADLPSTVVDLGCRTRPCVCDPPLPLLCFCCIHLRTELWTAGVRAATPMRRLVMVSSLSSSPPPRPCGKGSVRNNTRRFVFFSAPYACFRSGPWPASWTWRRGSDSYALCALTRRESLGGLSGMRGGVLGGGGGGGGGGGRTRRGGGGGAGSGRLKDCNARAAPGSTDDATDRGEEGAPPPPPPP